MHTSLTNHIAAILHFNKNFFFGLKYKNVNKSENEILSQIFVISSHLHLKLLASKCSIEAFN